MAGTGKRNIALIDERIGGYAISRIKGTIKGMKVVVANLDEYEPDENENIVRVYLASMDDADRFNAKKKYYVRVRKVGKVKRLVLRELE